MCPSYNLDKSLTEVEEKSLAIRQTFDQDFSVRKPLYQILVFLPSLLSVTLIFPYPLKPSSSCVTPSYYYWELCLFPKNKAHVYC